MKSGLKIGIVVLLGIMVGSNYNSLVSKKEKVDSAFADISVQLERRVEFAFLYFL